MQAPGRPAQARLPLAASAVAGPIRTFQQAVTAAVVNVADRGSPGTSATEPLPKGCAYPALARQGILANYWHFAGHFDPLRVVENHKVGVDTYFLTSTPVACIARKALKTRGFSLAMVECC